MSGTNYRPSSKRQTQTTSFLRIAAIRHLHDGGKFFWPPVDSPQNAVKAAVMAHIQNQQKT
jgi:hypothetical protein